MAQNRNCDFGFTATGPLYPQLPPPIPVLASVLNRGLRVYNGHARWWREVEGLRGDLSIGLLAGEGEAG